AVIVPEAAAARRPAVIVPEQVPEPERRPAVIVPEATSPPKGKAAASRRTGGKGKFRETLWFKKGELDEAGGPRGGPASPSRADALPLEDRYKDDGSLSTEDEGRLGLHTGATQSMPSVPGRQLVPGDGMAETSIVDELGARRTRIIAFSVALAILAAL